MLLGDFEHHVGVESREQHEPRAHRHRERQAQRESVGVEHRQDGVDDASVAACDRRHPRPRLRGVGEQVAVGERRALGRAGRAARVLDEREIVGRRLGVRGRQRIGPDDLLPGRRARDPLVQGRASFARLRDREGQRDARTERHRLRDVDGDEGRDGEVGGELLDRRDDLGPDDRVLRAVVLELLAQLARRVERIVLDDDGAEPQDRVEGDDVLRAVGQDDRDGIARRDAARLQTGRGALDLLVQLPVRRLAAEELQGGSIRILAGGCLDDVDERARHRLELRRHPLGVAGDPGARRVVRRHADQPMPRQGSRAGPAASRPERGN